MYLGQRDIRLIGCKKEEKERKIVDSIFVVNKNLIN